MARCLVARSISGANCWTLRATPNKWHFANPPGSGVSVMPMMRPVVCKTKSVLEAS